MSRDETAKGETAKGVMAQDGTASRALVVLAGPEPVGGARPRPRAAFLVQLATSDARKPPRALRAPEAVRLYAEAARRG